MLKKKILTGCLFAFAFTMGYVRETIFIVINAVIYDYPFPYNSSYITPPNFLYDCNNALLIKLKWGLTLLFSVLFMITTLLLNKVYFNSKKNKIIIITVYITLFSLSLLLVGIGFLLNQYELMYSLSRSIVGLLQYPLLPFILFSSLYYMSKKLKENKA